MSIERLGQFIEVEGEDGVRNVVRVNAIQLLCDVDELREETFMMVANRTILVREPLDEIREVLAEVSPRSRCG
jgi:hypothetical protein